MNKKYWSVIKIMRNQGNTRKKSIPILLSMVILLAFPLQAFCEDIHNLTYDAVEKTVLGKNADVLQNYYDYAGLDDGKTSATVIAAKGITIIQSNYKIVWTVQKEYISYKELERKLTLSQMKETQLALQLKITTAKLKMGNASRYDVLSVQSQLDEQKKSTKDIQKQMADIIESMNKEIGQNTDTALSIGAAPTVSAETVEAINVDEDYKLAVIKSYDIKLTEISGNNYTEPAKETIRKAFKTSFYGAYDNLKDALDNYEYAEKQTEKAQLDYTTAQKKFKYGFISQQSLQSAAYTWESTKSNLETLNDSLYEAYQLYQYAKNGIILN